MFWLTWVAGFTIIQSFGYPGDFYRSWTIYYLGTLPLFVAHTYLIAYWLIPRYFFQQRFGMFAALVFAFLVIASVLELLLSNELIWKLTRPEFVQAGNYFSLSNILINGIGNEYIVVVFLSIKVVKYWNSKKGEEAELQNRKLAGEIEWLKLKSYPRFFLNVIQRLENLATQSPDQTPEMIVRISAMLSHIPSVPQNRILLHTEVEIIKRYLEIQRLSFWENRRINLISTGNLKRHPIPAFLFFQIVDEGFCIVENFQHPTDFNITVRAEERYVLFSMNIWTQDAFIRKYDQSIVENSRKYLSYFYPDNYRLISNFEVNFVELTIEIYEKTCQ